jgi:nucleoside-diphosphate-sugar epimerase
VDHVRGEKESMRVLITGHDGYIGSVLAPFLRDASHEVAGLDTYLFEGCSLGEDADDVPAQRVDVRDVGIELLRGFDAVVHLAAISNDPMGDLDPSLTYEINHLASVRLARLAKEAGVERFVFASSCSLYGAASPNEFLTEDAAFNPVTPYGESKVLVERDVAGLSDDGFSPTFLRNATVYGYSPRLRLDLVVNDLVASAFVSGDILIKSDGTPWRPLVHIEDVARAALAALEAPREAIHNEAFNIGRTRENYQISDVADIVTEIVPGSRATYADGGGPDARCYRVDFSKAEAALPGFEPRWSVSDGVQQLAQAYGRYGLEPQDLASPRFVRLRRIQTLQSQGKLSPDLRWLPAPDPVAAGT